MLLIIKYLFYFLLYHQIIYSFPQINLDLTEWENYNNLDIQHDCLHLSILHENINDPYEIISYCMSEWPFLQWNITKTNDYPSFTFAELLKKNITSKQLYQWSGSMDIIEKYEDYLNKISSKSIELFYNCTLPRFGPLCQYSFDDYNSNDKSLNEFISNFYLKNLYQPTELTCYIHLECQRGFQSICLDWTDICDGKIDCFNNGIDEEQCWKIEISNCKDNEYRCSNGQCISERFLHDNSNNPDCLDATDEIFSPSLKRDNCYNSEPLFSCEDVMCTSYHWQHHYKPLTSSCVKQRTDILVKEIFSQKPNNISDDCWSAYKCILHMPDVDDPICRDLCRNGECTRIIRTNCPDTMLFLPRIPILFGHIYFGYMKNFSRYLNNIPQCPQYMCYNNQLCNGFLSNKTLISFNNITCRAPQDFPLNYEWISSSSWLLVCVAPYYKKLHKCNTILRDNLTFCNQSTMYQCKNSSKCISKYRIYDGLVDCDYNDDEDSSLLENVYPIEGLKRFFKCQSQPNKYIRLNQVGDNSCECFDDETDLCDDELLELHYIRKHISFSTICDGFTELMPIYTNEKNETDETGCDYWPCHNIYTHCNGFWNCLDGSDELNCNEKPLLNCSSHSHICISIETKQLMCLSLDKVNNGDIDCLGGIDEIELCRRKDHHRHSGNFYCRGDLYMPCRSFRDVCAKNDGICQFGIDSESCSNLWNISLRSIQFCEEEFIFNRNDIEKYFCSLSDDIIKPGIVHFVLDRTDNMIKNKTKQSKSIILSSSSLIKTMNQHQNHRCHRGLPLSVWLNNRINSSIVTCLCPPSFYGKYCQYQNQRVALTLEFRPYAFSRRISFVIILKLIDNSEEEIIHSYQQLTYFPFQHCQMKFNIYLLYSKRPKNDNKHYFIHIDFYEKSALKYQGSLLLPIEFNFLPVYRISTILNIPYLTENIHKCSNDDHCIHGKCREYFQDIENRTFCQCDHGWSGRYCNISHKCSCSSDSLCIGISANQRSICICPINKWGSRCLLHNQICQSNQNQSICYNDGQCIPLDPYVLSKKKFECICKKGYYGDRCENLNNEIILTIEENILLSESLLIHFIQIMNNATPEIGSTFKNIPIYKKSISIYWSRPYHIAFIELLNNHNYYLIHVQKTNLNHSIKISKLIQLSDRCLNTNELFNQTFLQYHLIIRIKYYHLLCQNSSLKLSCFYDEIHFCLCMDFNNQRHANCLEFNHTLIRNCSRQNNCQNNGQCLQDTINCPTTSTCICLPCFHGKQCQFNFEQFSLSLDAILGYHIGPYISIFKQPFIVQVSMGLTIIISLAGFLNGILSLITFNNKTIKKTGCGIYLLISSIISTITIIIFALKCSILLIAQITYLKNRLFLYLQCLSLDCLLRIGLNIDQWLNACVAIERVRIMLKGVHFNLNKNQHMAKYVILILLFIVISTSIHDPFYRRLIDEDDNNNDDDQRIWCIITYPSHLKIYNSIINIFHFFLPFSFNLISSIIIITLTARQRIAYQTHRNYREVLYEQLKIHKHLFLAPIILVILAIPRLLISFVSACMKSSRDSWLFLFGYFISFIPPILTFTIFVLPSKIYKDEFRKSIKRYRQLIRRYLHLGI